MASIFWKAGNNPICSALCATRIFKSLAVRVYQQKDAYDRLARQFEELACDTLEVCAKGENGLEKCQSLLASRVEEFGMCSALEMAIAADGVEFLCSASSQSLITKIWYGVIEPDTPNLPVSIIFLCVCVFM